MVSLIAKFLGPTSLSNSKASESSFHGFGEKFDEESNVTISLYPFQYSDKPAIEACILGVISLSVTLLNILCIILTGIVILKLKEVTPDKIPQKFSTFWKRDIKAHIKHGRTLRKGEEHKQEKRDILTEMRLELAKDENFKEEDIGLQGTFIQSMFDRAIVDGDLINIRQWTALPSAAIEQKTTPSRHFGNNHHGDYSLLSPHSGSTLYGDISPQVRALRPLHISPQVRFRKLQRLQSNPDNQGQFLDLPDFFKSEIQKSKDFRQKLHATAPVLAENTYPRAKNSMPTDV